MECQNFKRKPNNKHTNKCVVSHGAVLDESTARNVCVQLSKASLLNFYIRRLNVGWNVLHWHKIHLYHCAAAHFIRATIRFVTHTHQHSSHTHNYQMTNWMNGWLLTQYSNVIVPQSFCCRLIILDARSEWQLWQANRKISHNGEQQQLRRQRVSTTPTTIK